MVQALCHFRIGYKTYHYEVKPPGIRRGALPRLSKNPPGFSDKRFAVCCAHIFELLAQNSTLAA